MTAMLRIPRDATTLRWLKLLAAVLLALWFAFGPRPVWSQEAGLEGEPPMDSAVRIEELKDKVAADPYDAEAHTQLGILYAQENLLEEARASFIMALQAAPAEPSSHLNLGLIFMRMEAWNEAINTLGNYALMTNVEARGHILLGECYEAQDDLERARSVWMSAAETPGMPAKERVLLVERTVTSWFDAKDPAGALRALEQDPELLKEPDASTLRDMAGYAHLTQAKRAKADGKLEDALRHYRRTRELDPDNAAAYSEPLQIHLDAGRVADAEALADQANETLPDTAVAAFLGARVAESRGDLRAAADGFRRTSELDPEFPGVFASLGGVLAQLGDESGAQAALAEAVKRGDGGAAASFNMGVVLSKEGKHAEALSHLQTAVAADPDMKDAHRALGTAYRKLKRYKDAAETYETIVGRFGPDPADLYQLAYAQGRSDRHADAVRNYEMVVALQPTNFNAFYNLGNSLLSLDRNAEAADAFNQALTLGPPSSSLHERAQYNLALCYQKQELYEEAIAEYKKALDLKETYRSLVNLAICYAAIEDTETSDEYYARAAELKNG